MDVLRCNGKKCTINLKGLTPDLEDPAWKQAFQSTKYSQKTVEHFINSLNGGLFVVSPEFKMYCHDENENEEEKASELSQIESNYVRNFDVSLIIILKL